jgi:hypothetical protein
MVMRLLLALHAYYDDDDDRQHAQANVRVVGVGV